MKDAVKTHRGVLDSMLPDDAAAPAQSETVIDFRSGQTAQGNPNANAQVPATGSPAGAGRGGVASTAQLALTAQLRAAQTGSGGASAGRPGAQAQKEKTWDDLVKEGALLGIEGPSDRAAKAKQMFPEERN